MTTTPDAVLPNIRDLGGLPTHDGRRTRQGVLYRSAAPLAGDVPPAGVPTWPCRTVIDLRAPGELGAPHPLLGDGVTVHAVPFLDDDQLHTLPPGGLADIYRMFVEQAAERIVEVLTVAATADAPVLIHCAAGKDRTGVAIALLLTLAGVDRAEIVADYTRTEHHLPAIRTRLSAAGTIHPPGMGTRTNDELLGAPAAAIEAVLDQWTNHPGGTLGWLHTNGADRNLATHWNQHFVQ